MDLLAHLDDVRDLLRHRPAGLFVDIDGTLAPIVSTPSKVRVTPQVRGALDTLASGMTVVALTGRGVADARRVIRLDSITYAGNHGLEWWSHGDTLVLPDAQPYLQQLHALAQEATQRLRSISGVLVENKGATIALHFRLSGDPDAARSAILEFLETAPSARGLVQREGKMIVEVWPPGEVNKGTALRSVVERHGLRSAIVLGDDRTDLDSFRAVQKLRQEARFRGVTVAVASADAPAELVAEADYQLPDTDGVAHFLGWLVKASRSLP